MRVAYINQLRQRWLNLLAVTRQARLASTSRLRASGRYRVAHLEGCAAQRPWLLAVLASNLWGRQLTSRYRMRRTNSGHTKESLLGVMHDPLREEKRPSMRNDTDCNVATPAG